MCSPVRVRRCFGVEFFLDPSWCRTLRSSRSVQTSSHTTTYIGRGCTGTIRCSAHNGHATNHVTCSSHGAAANGVSCSVASTLHEYWLIVLCSRARGPPVLFGEPARRTARLTSSFALHPIMAVEDPARRSHSMCHAPAAMQDGCSALPKLRAGSSATHLSPVEEIR